MTTSEAGEGFRKRSDGARKLVLKNIDCARERICSPGVTFKAGVPCPSFAGYGAQSW